MTKPSGPPAVTTFADHDVIVPPHPLKKAMVRPNPGDPAEPDPVVRAEQALFEISGEFSRWMESECARLDKARHAVAGGFTGKTRDELFRAAHDIKGEAATFGFPLIEPVAASLCRLIEHSPDLARVPHMLIDQHVNARGNTERKAQVLARRLRQVTEEFLQHENRHRPGYLEEVAS
jgi:HPt (histidine-containing phosphotransfer) domain-containing protein